MSKLENIIASISKCQKCRLHKTRTNTVPGEGPDTASVMFIGEAPGEQEDLTGQPFIGRSGKLLAQLMKEAGLPRQRVFITNTVKCRPPNNRNPISDEVDECRPYLFGQISTVKPTVIVLVGNIPTKWVLGRGPISQVRGRPIEKDGKVYLPVFHPAYALRNPKAREILAKDLMKVNALVRQYRKPEA